MLGANAVVEARGNVLRDCGVSRMSPGGAKIVERVAWVAARTEEEALALSEEFGYETRADLEADRASCGYTWPAMKITIRVERCES